MAPAHKPSRQRQRAELPPRNKGIVLLTNPMAPFDPDAPIGAYPIDAFASGLPWSRWSRDLPEAEKVDLLRDIVAKTGRGALARAQNDAADADLRSDAAAHLKALADLGIRARLVAQRDAAPFFGFFVQWPKIDKGTSDIVKRDEGLAAATEAHAAIHRLADLARALASAIDEFERQFPINKAYNRRNRSPLEHRFVEMMGDAYEALTDHPPPASRTGSYAQLLAAAWLSLGFPDPGPEVDMVETLGRLNEAHSKRR